MAYGFIGDPGGLAATPDIPGLGPLSWAEMAGMSPEHPMVGGPDIAGLGAFDVDRGRSRIVSLPDVGPTAGPVAGPGVNLIDDWRDLFNFRGSPMPWLLLGSVVVLGLMQLRISARVGKSNIKTAIG
jgi:hypothetical protein